MDSGTFDFALMEFHHTEGAERAYSDAPASVDGVAWAQKVAFVEHHRHNRIVVRGAFAGRYVDADDEQELTGPKSAEGVVAGGAVGVLFGPLGLAVGLVGGGVAGGVAQERSSPRLRSAFFDEIRREVPKGGSAVIVLATPEQVDAMVKAFDGSGGRLVRHRLGADEAKALEAAVAEDPEAVPPA